jgi:photosystem II stability/assembly factor-like uncharacterized protein
VARVAGVPGDPYTYYAATASGGVWKSLDGGTQWKPVFDDQPVSSIGSIAVAPSDANVVYVGSGEANIRGNVAQGNGIYKSTDAGKTWQHVFAQDGQIGTLVVHPTNPDVAYAAVLGKPFGPNPERGVYRTRDGGKTWDRVLARDPDTGASDVALDPSNPRIVYAGMWQARRRPWELVSGGPGSGLYVSRDGGDTWKRLEGHGLPEGIWGKVGVAVAPSEPRRVYAVIEAEKGGLYRADDGGIYYVQRSFNTLWWVGMSLDKDPSAQQQWHRGLNFTNVFRGTIRSDNTIVGDWSDVTRGGTLNSGTLVIRINSSSSGTQLSKIRATGGFGATTWHKSDALDDLKLILLHRLEQLGLGPAGGFLERHRTGDLERHFVRVHVVVRPVVQVDQHVVDRVAGQDARGHGLADAHVDRLDELPRNRSAGGVVLEQVAFAGLARDEADLRVPVLAAAAGLLGVLHLAVRRTGECFLVGHLRLADGRLDAERRRCSGDHGGRRVIVEPMHGRSGCNDAEKQNRYYEKSMQVRTP